MEYITGIFGLFILASSVNLLPTPEDGSKTGRNVKIHQGVETQSGGWSNHTVSRRSTETFIFPGSTTGEKKFIPKVEQIPDCAKGSTFCENIDDYPMKYLENILQDVETEYKTMFGNDILDESTIIHRIDPIEESPLCSSLPEIMYPRVAKNKDEKWLFVVNQGEYVQGIRVEKCQEPDKPPKSCRFSDSFPDGYKAYCKQKVVYRKLIALNEGGKTITDDFEIPSCCACVVETTKGTLHSKGGTTNKKN